MLVTNRPREKWRWHVFYFFNFRRRTTACRRMDVPDLNRSSLDPIVTHSIGERKCGSIIWRYEEQSVPKFSALSIKKEWKRENRKKIKTIDPLAPTQAANWFAVIGGIREPNKKSRIVAKQIVRSWVFCGRLGFLLFFWRFLFLSQRDPTGHLLADVESGCHSRQAKSFSRHLQKGGSIGWIWSFNGFSLESLYP